MTKRTVEVDSSVIDSTDLANIGLVELVDPVIELAGEPDKVGVFDQRVRIRGELTIEEVSDDD